jgi:hypothetical protein
MVFVLNTPGASMGYLPSKKSNLSNANTKLPERAPGTISLLQLPAPASPPRHSWPATTVARYEARARLTLCAHELAGTTARMLHAPPYLISF